MAIAHFGVIYHLLTKTCHNELALAYQIRSDYTKTESLIVSHKFNMHSTHQTCKFITMAKSSTKTMTTTIYFASISQEHCVVFVQCDLHTLQQMSSNQQAPSTSSTGTVYIVRHTTSDVVILACHSTFCLKF